MFAENLAPFFAASGMGVAVTVDGQAREAIFDSEFQLGGLTATGIASAQPMLTLRTADVPASPVGKTTVVGSTTYTIVEHQPDGTGVSRLMLERA
jgi:hypothetical protein